MIYFDAPGKHGAFEVRTRKPVFSLLAGLGLYGVTSYAVSRHRGEIGIRMALGAAPESVIRLVLGRVSALVAIGILVGAGLSLWGAQFVSPRSTVSSPAIRRR